MQCVVYARVSTREQEENGYSIPFQLEQCRKKATEDGYTIVEEFVEAESASKQGRPGFTRMLNYLKDQPGVGVILCHKVDRLCRNLFDINEVRKLDRTLKFVQEEYADNASGELHFGLKVLLAEHYSRNLSEEVKKGQKAKLDMGLYPGQAPRGYRSVRGDDGKSRIQPDPKIGPIITWMFETYASGNWSLREIADEAAYRGLTTRNSKPLSAHRVKVILQRKTYAGQIEWRGTVRPGKHEPLVSERVFDQVQQSLLRRSRETRPARNGKLPFLLRGLLVCGSCGRKLTTERHSRGSYYRCTRPSLSATRCSEPYSPAHLLDGQVEAFLSDLKPTAKLKQALRTEWDQMLAQAKASRRNEEGPLKGKLNEVERRRIRLAEAYSSGTMPLDVYQKTSQNLEEERHQILELLSQFAPEEPDAIRRDLEKCLNFADSLWDMYQDAAFPEKQEMLSVLFHELTVSKREFSSFSLNEPFNSMFTG